MSHAQELLTQFARRTQTIQEACRLLGVIEAGEYVDESYLAAAAFHLDAIESEYPSLNQSRMAHRLAHRLRLWPLSWWDRVKVVFGVSELAP